MPGFVAEHLNRPENQYLHTALKVSAQYGLPPLFFLDPRASKPKWTLADKKLVLGWQKLQDETCKRCGVPVWLGHSEDNHIDFETSLSICYSCQHLETRDTKNDAKGATAVIRPVPAKIEGEDIKLPSRLEAMETVQ